MKVIHFGGEEFLILLCYYGNMDYYVIITFSFVWGVMAVAVNKGEPIGFMPDDEHPGNDNVFLREVIGFADADGNQVDDRLVTDIDADLYAIYTEDSYAWEGYSLPS